MEHVSTYFTIIYVINFIFILFGLYEKIALKIKLPKNKKYKDKVNPIYCIESGYLQPNELYINKYEHKYVENVSTILISLFLLPYPIFFYSIKYSNVGTVYFCPKKDINNWNHVNISEYYEKYMEEKNSTEQNKKIVDLQIANQINNFNKVFNENYKK